MVVTSVRKAKSLRMRAFRSSSPSSTGRPGGKLGRAYSPAARSAGASGLSKVNSAASQAAPRALLRSPATTSSHAGVSRAGGGAANPTSTSASTTTSNRLCARSRNIQVAWLPKWSSATVTREGRGVARSEADSTV